MRLLFSFFLITSLNAFSQVEELKTNQDLRKTKFERAVNTNGGVRQRLRYDFSKHVNPFIGTGAHGHTHPAATAPFGMIQLGPDTRYNGWDGCSGYHYSDSVIYGFSHTHLSGTGVEDLCDLLIVPQQGKCLTEAGYKNKAGFGSKFSHSQEKASPGYYEVKLFKNDIDVKLASTERAGIHEYTFNQTKGKKYILIDLEHRDNLLDYEFNVIDKNRISGKRVSNAWAKNQHFYFYLETEIPYKKFKLTKNKKLILEFPESTKVIKLKVGISAVDIEGARKNVFEEIQGFDLEMIKSLTRNQWNTEMNKLHFHSEDEAVMTNFYTAVYHSYLSPSLFSDVDGRFRGNDNLIHESVNKKRYTIFSIWDTYRSAHPLYTLTQVKRTEDFIQTFLDIYKETNELPVWELWGNETDCMIGYHATSIIADAYFKGITNFDSEKALEAMLVTSQKDELGKKIYKEYGFLSSNKEPESVSKTLEYAYDDWTISQFAKTLGKEDEAREYLSRSSNFINIFDPQTKFMRPKNGGIWLNPFMPSEVNFNFTEANSYQYSLSMPHNINAMRKLLGGKDSLEFWLDRLFTTSSKLEGRQQSDITGLIGQYAHGNEPSHHMAYLYNYTNSPYKTQEKVNQILHELYTPTPEGLSGNEDCGQMSAWYVLSAVGLYPICPGSPIYTFGRPLQEYANFHFENGKTMAILTKNNSKENKYIQKVELNGENYTNLFISHEDLLKGGELIFYMGNEVNSDLNSFKREIKDKDFIDSNFMPVPYFTATKNTFYDSITTEIKMIDLPNFQIRFTTNGAEPNLTSEIYRQPLTFHATTELKAKCFQYEGGNSEVKKVDNSSEKRSLLYKLNDKKAVSSIFYKLKEDLNLEVTAKYNNQYTAGGNLALIDGIYGLTDFRSGAWQGYEGDNASGIITFKNPKKVESLEISCLQDIKSWIFMPTEIQLELSYDGIKFEKSIKRKVIYPSDKFGSFQEKILVPVNLEGIKAIKYSIVNRKTCPKGHLGEGEKSWLFVDEIGVK
ncbi:MAG: GH92 family glycosyl hydrolase [Bacteroidota bacterium]